MGNSVKNCLCLLLLGMVCCGIVGCGQSDKSANLTAQPGKLIIYSAGPKKLADEIQKGFEAKTGIKVAMFQGTTGKI